MTKNVIEACKMFLVPASILFVAIGSAGTEPLKTLISAMGAGLSVCWFIGRASWDEGRADSEKLSVADKKVMLWLASTFLAASVVSMGVHGFRWYWGL
jgi:hypothetical protein